MGIFFQKETENSWKLESLKKAIDRLPVYFTLVKLQRWDVDEDFAGLGRIKEK